MVKLQKFMKFQGFVYDELIYTIRLTLTKYLVLRAGRWTNNF